MSLTIDRNGVPLNSDFKADIQKQFHGEVRFDLGTRILYSTDASIYQIKPLGVVFPRTQEELHAIVELASKNKVPILARGAGTSLAGQAIGEALILDCSRYLNKLIDIDPKAQTATVEPGLVLSQLNTAAAKYGLMFGPDPASAERATMGGVIGNNATGAHSITYGMAVDHILSAEIIQADGSLATWAEIDLSSLPNQTSKIALAVTEIRNKYSKSIMDNYPETWRNSAGYRLNYLLPWSPSSPPNWNAGKYPSSLNSNKINLSALLAGSEGTLAVMRQAKVKLVPKPKNTILGVLPYASVEDACDDVPRLLEIGPSAIELIPKLLIQLAKNIPTYASQLKWVRGEPAAVLVVEFSGSNLKAVKDAVKLIGSEVFVAETAEQQANIWNVRKVGLGIFDSQPTDKRPVAFIEDCAIPIEKLGEFVRETDRILTAHNTFAAYYAHASAGCLHIRPMMDLKQGAGNLRSIAEAVLALTLKLGGSMSSEHGDGISRAEFLEQIYGAQVTKAMRLLKSALDPENLLNPGKMLDAPPMDSNLRYGNSYKTKPWESVISFKGSNGLAGAIEKCNGQGVCRKDSEVMCPSFQASREESNSTRGRANLLRALITQPAGHKSKEIELQKATFEALDLCLACKGCKAECPSGVDMAKLKYEFQHEYYKSHRRRVRDYLFAYIDIFARWGAPLGKLINWINGLSITRKLGRELIGLAEKRRLPKFTTIFDSHFKQTTSTESVIYLRDVYTHYFETEVELAALEILSACGVQVKILPIIGAGRTLISKGFLPAAKKHAERVLDEIRKIDPEGQLDVVGVEPSEIYTFRDEFHDLLPECADEVTALSARSWLLDEYFVRPGKSDTIRIANLSNTIKPEDNSKIYLHGHCYQKTQPPHIDGFPIGQNASAEMLRNLGYEVQIIPSGCCGMAGAFGYEAEHYELSMQVGELILFPYIRKLGVENHKSLILAPGVSCRAQIADGVNISVQHPIVHIASSLRH
ncbi:MAG: FAD-linked oxidase C-terminal domain-containing protein [Anaerolineae bacterium]|nr:FAD-linked oxidase C-terminal domain-containing protein [Anaerolineae bacterium]